MDGILGPLLAVLVIVLPLWGVYGLLEWQERIRKKRLAKPGCPQQSESADEVLEVGVKEIRNPYR